MQPNTQPQISSHPTKRQGMDNSLVMRYKWVSSLWRSSSLSVYSKTRGMAAGFVPTLPIKLKK